MSKKIIHFFLLSLIFLTCSSFTVIGHRGDPIKAPEETFQSFNTAFDEGADYVELDVQLSKDNVLVISHDKNLARITGQPYEIRQTDWEVMSKLHTSNGENVHSLNQVFSYYKSKPNTKFLIETKSSKTGKPKKLESTLVKVIKKYHMENRVMVHSFSEMSLIRMKELMPSIPRIFIAGSLKRLNFEVFQTSTGVNISSNLVNTTLVNQLHAIGQKVYVWDEMNESPEQWNWLINQSIDGVVTNYPATGNKYRELKDDSRITKTDSPKKLVSTKKATIWENPYTQTDTGKKAKPFKEYTVSEVVHFNSQTFINIGDNQYVLANGFNNSDNVQNLVPYLGATLSIKDKNRYYQLYNDPFNSILASYTVNPYKNYKITGIQKIGSSYWFKIKGGWILADNTLIKMSNDVNDQNFRLKMYLRIPEKQRLNNIDLAKSTPNFQTILQKHPKKIIKSPFTLPFDSKEQANNI